ncbi:hypothetical protein G2W53_018066 [Senna tora]|uniref:Uncharacterized protein n=1 Tax=Senna tora TaxID=362788 RepID=A0A834TT25_9FABA|nr:hypothetical protein G2W53_018066 [Senna tora]
MLTSDPSSTVSTRVKIPPSVLEIAIRPSSELERISSSAEAFSANLENFLHSLRRLIRGGTALASRSSEEFSMLVERLWRAVHQGRDGASCHDFDFVSKQIETQKVTQTLFHTTNSFDKIMEAKNKKDPEHKITESLQQSLPDLDVGTLPIRLNDIVMMIGGKKAILGVEIEEIVEVSCDDKEEFLGLQRRSQYLGNGEEGKGRELRIGPMNIRLAAAHLSLKGQDQYIHYTDNFHVLNVELSRLRSARRAASRASRLDEESMQTRGGITPAAANFERVLDEDFLTSFLISLAASILDRKSPLISFSDSCKICVCFLKFHVSISSCSLASSATFSPSPIIEASNSHTLSHCL